MQVDEQIVRIVFISRSSASNVCSRYCVGNVFGNAKLAYTISTTKKLYPVVILRKSNVIVGFVHFRLV